jgi:hypothetical protein
MTLAAGAKGKARAGSEDRKREMGGLPEVSAPETVPLVPLLEHSSKLCPTEASSVGSPAKRQGARAGALVCPSQ